MHNWIVRLIMAFSFLWRRLGADPGQLETILRVKLTIDDRRPAVGFAQRQRATNKPVKNRGIATIVTSLLMGVVYILICSKLGDTFTTLALYFLLFMVLLSLTLISDFTYVLIDSKDNFIILPRPVNAQTILLSRLLHIFIHLGKIVVPMSLPGFIYFWVTTGSYGALLFGVVALMATLMCIFLINAVYLVILRFTTIERFKDAIGSIQIVFSVLIFVLYYFGPRMARQMNLSETVLLGHRYTYIAPPMWLAALWEVARHPQGQSLTMLCLGAVGLFFPLACIWAVVRFLAPQFDRKLGGLGGGSVKKVRKKSSEGRKPLYRIMSGLFTRGNDQAAGFEMAWMLSGRSRDFKLKVYPSFAYVIVYFFYFSLNMNKVHGQSYLGYLAGTRSYILLIYLSSFALITAITYLVYSDKYKAAWVYYASPLKVPGEVLMGAVKAMMAKFFLPFYAVVMVFSLFVWGPGVLPDMLLGLINVIWFGVLMGFIYLRRLPFSAPFNVQAGSGRFLKNLFILGVPGVTGVAHYMLRKYIAAPYALWIFIVLALGLVWLIYGRYKELSWTELDYI